MSRTATFVRCLAGLAALAAAGSSTPAWAKNSSHAEKGIWAITLRVYDYAQVNRSTMRAAEGEATKIFAHAGVDARWVDCPTSRTDWDNFPNCRSAWQANDYVLRVMPKAMAGLLGKSQDTLGSAMDCGIELSCAASVFYDRVMSLAGGASAPVEILLGRAMAHEIGHLLLGANSHSPTGIMRANWSDREFRPDACTELLFTAEQSRRMRSRLTEQTLTRQAKAAEVGR
jgi:hypothetical protein